MKDAPASTSLVILPFCAVALDKEDAIALKRELMHGIPSAEAEKSLRKFTGIGDHHGR